MSPTHHCPDALLTCYALGSLDPAVSVLVATHLTLCPTCRVRATALEAVGGELLADEPPVPITDAEVDAVIARLDDPPPPDPAPTDPAGVLPRPIVRLVGGLRELRWRPVVPRVAMVDLPVPVAGPLPLRLYRFRRGYRMPVHRHHGEERAVILSGGWSDQTGEYHRGDWFGAGPALQDHALRCFPDEDCITLVLNDRPMEPTNPVYRWLARLGPAV